MMPINMQTETSTFLSSNKNVNLASMVQEPCNVLLKTKSCEIAGELVECSWNNSAFSIDFHSVDKQQACDFIVKVIRGGIVSVVLCGNVFPDSYIINDIKIRSSNKKHVTCWVELVNEKNHA